MRHFYLLLCCTPLLAGPLLDSAEPVTLDPAEMSRIWADIRGCRAEASPVADGWRAAMLEQDEELARVLLLAWLQQQNPALGLEAAAKDYAQAVSLHRQALRGNAAACAACAVAYRAGQLGELSLPVSEQKARWFEQRSIVSGNLPE